MRPRFALWSCRLAVLAALTALGAASAAAQCWSGGATGKGVPRESLMISNEASFPVNVLAGPLQGVRRVLGAVPAKSTMSFPAVLAPGRNEVVVWVDPAEAEKAKLKAARLRGTIAILDRKNNTCRRSAQLTINADAFDATKPRAPGALAPGAGNRTTPAKPKEAKGAPR